MAVEDSKKKPSKGDSDKKTPIVKEGKEDKKIAEVTEKKPSETKSKSSSKTKVASKVKEAKTLKSNKISVKNVEIQETGQVIEVSEKRTLKQHKSNSKSSYKGKTVTVIQYSSAIRRHKKQSLILRGLGMKKVGNKVIVPDTPEFRGMINKIPHLVKVVDDA